MRPSERIKLHAAHAGKYDDMNRAKTLVKMRQCEGRDRGRAMSVSDPFYHDPPRRRAIAQAEIRALATEEARLAALGQNAPSGNATWKEADWTKLSVTSLNREMPGYSGFVPGKTAENIFRLTPMKTAIIARTLRS